MNIYVMSIIVSRIVGNRHFYLKIEKANEKSRELKSQL